MEYCDADGRINSVDDQATSDINLVDFWPVPPEFTRIFCIEQASKALGLVYLRLITVSTVMFRNYSLWDNTATQSGLYVRLCHAFLVLSIFLRDMLHA